MYVIDPCWQYFVDWFKDAKSAWSVEGYVDPARSHKIGHLGFEVGKYVVFAITRVANNDPML